MANESCMRFFILGKVQGVWFRASTKKKADELNIKGWAKNLSDGRVEVMACGEASQLEELYEWLKDGPYLAKVKDCTKEEAAWQQFTEFSVG